jgi:translocation and assembly module TamB
MRRKAVVYSVSAGLILVLLFFSGGVFWVLGTSAGARWLMGEVSSHTSLTLEAKQVRGRIWGDLRLENVGIRWPEGTLHAESFQVRWSPLRLLYGEVAVREFVIHSVNLQDNRPEAAEVPEIAWPHATGLLSRLDAEVDAFRIKGATYRRLQNNPVELSNISGRISWRNGILTVRGLKAGSSLGKTEGTFEAGFTRPSLSLRLVVRPAKPVAGLDVISVDAGLRARRVSAPLKGDVHLTGSSGKTLRIEFSSGLEVDRRAVKLTDFHVTRIIKNGSVKGSGEVTFSEGGPRFRLAIDTSGVDLSDFLHARTDLSAHLVLEGSALRYHGRLDLSNKGDGLRTIHLSGSLEGDKRGLQLTSLEGSWLDGQIGGAAHAGWEKGVSLRASLQMRGLDPSLISPEWTGQINTDISGSALMARNEPVAASFSVDLLNSSLRGKALTGRVKAGLVGSNLRIERLLLRGKGFNITARGELSKRIILAADISDLSGLVPGAKGALHTVGRVRWHEGLFSGNLEGRAGGIVAGGLRVGTADFSGSLAENKEHSMHVRTSVTALAFGRIKIESADLNADGTLEDHVIGLAVRSPGAAIDAELSGGYKEGKWEGKISKLSDRDASGVLRLSAPTALTVSGKKFSLSGLMMTGARGESVKAVAELAFRPLDGSLEVEWTVMDLGRANYWLNDIQVAGKSSGKIVARWLRNALYRLSAHAEASGNFSTDGQKIEVSHASVQVDRDEHRLLASFDFGIDKATVVKGRFSSVVKDGMFLPEEGTIDAELHGLDLSLFRRWVPEGIEVGGMVSGALRGRLTAARSLDITGNASISGGVIRRQAEKGEISIAVRRADMKFVWNKASLKGAVSLVLENYGHAEGRFEIPLAASLPPSMEADGRVRASLKGQFQEDGLLSAIFPGLVQETHGRIDLGIEVGGVWKAPVLKGKVQLSRAGAYFPAGGIRIKDAGMTARLDGDRVTVDSFHVSSGPGKLEGHVEIRLKDRAVVSYKGTLKGKNFQVIYLPELRVQASPDLAFEGSDRKLSVRGEIKVPYLLVLQSKTRTPVEPSKDIVIVDREEKPRKEAKTAIDIQVRIVLGDRVLVKAEGIDAQMGGSIDVIATGVHDIKGRGEIHVVKGKYSAYGVSLDIQRGRVIFSGQSINRPSLDVLALRKAGDVKAGVTVTGTPRNPVVKLYSDPPMADTDILAYIVLGHPLGGGQQQTDLVARAAGFLLSASDSVVFQDQLKHRLGIDTLDIESAPAGQETGQQGVSRSLVTVGKYLTPDLYISYGRSLLGDTNLFRVRYSLSKHWELETESGTESGADLFYKIDLR